MTSILWIACVTLLLVVVQAEAWLPPGIYKFKQRIQKKNTSNRRTNQRNSTSTENDEGVVTENDEVAKEEAAATEQSRLSLLPWWEDSWSEAFMNSFPLSPAAASALSSGTTPNSSDNNRQQQQIVDDDLAHYEKPKPDPSAQVLHFCFLLHGHRGFSTDLSYLQRVMQHHAELEKQQREQESNSNSTETPTTSDNNSKHDMIVHCAVCNEGKTQDGVVNGGERMVQEILQVIRTELKQRKQQQQSDDESEIQDITISIVGNSLGGIYGRYAIARIAQKAADEENHPELSHFMSNETSTNASATDSSPGCVLLDGKYRMHFNIFCTTATPHLGISKHTYVPLPRSVEVGAAHVLGETGRDLFRLNDLMKTMATCPTFLEPLRNFRKRVAYANAYATDFPVPATTAAFLSSQSTYPHHFAAEEEEENDDNSDNSSNQSASTTKPTKGRRHVVATLHTPAAKNLPAPFRPGPEEEAIADDLVQMSYSLDSLGWKKVFIDVRKEIPLRVSLPRTMNIRKSLKKSLILSPKRLRKSLSSVAQSTTSSASTLSDDDEGNNNNKKKRTTSISAPVSPTGSDKEYDSDESSDYGSGGSGKKKRPSAIHRLRQKGVVESRDVASVVSTPDDMRLSFPLGHNLMVALDRDGITGGIYKGGRPVMDSLAKELVHDIFDWNFQEESDVAAKETVKLSKSTVSK